MLDVALRPVCESDQRFLYQVYASTRQEELALTGWTLDQRESFLMQQFFAQDHHYRKYYPECSFDLVLLDGKPAGRFYVVRWQNEIRIVDIALLTEFRGKGVGSLLLKGLLKESRETKSRVSIHVERNNPARQWYMRLGFSENKTNDGSVYCLMKTDFTHVGCAGVTG